MRNRVHTFVTFSDLQQDYSHLLHCILIYAVALSADPAARSFPAGAPLLNFAVLMTSLCRQQVVPARRTSKSMQSESQCRIAPLATVCNHHAY